uniref:Uncharacterized protein n=1 Tax=Oryza barthii TaxID=65489 RepID=A0A0D3GPG9_9ORYZ
MAAAADQVGEGGDAAGGTLGSFSLSAGAKLSSPRGVVVDQLGEGGDTVGGAPGPSSPGVGAKSSTMPGAAADYPGKGGDTTAGSSMKSSPPSCATTGSSSHGCRKLLAASNSGKGQSNC